jgi:hypothetical protein
MRSYYLAGMRCRRYWLVEEAMKKIPLSDNSGRWFDKDKAKAFEAAYYCHPNGDPDRPICHATGDEHSSETLYLTDQGTFILNYECSWMDIYSYTEVPPERATQWLIANGHQDRLSQLELLPEEANLKC